MRRCELSLAAEVGLLAHMRYLASVTVERAASAARIVQARASARAVVAVAGARACSIVAMGTAVAEVMELKAEAYAGYGPAALLDGILEGLLPLARAYVAPLRKITSAVYIANGSEVRRTALSPLPLISSYKPEKSLWSRRARAPASSRARWC